MGFGVWGLGFRVQGLGFRVQGLGFRVQGLGFCDERTRRASPTPYGTSAACLSTCRHDVRFGARVHYASQSARCVLDSSDTSSSPSRNIVSKVHTTYWERVCGVGCGVRMCPQPPFPVTPTETPPRHIAFGSPCCFPLFAAGMGTPSSLVADPNDAGENAGCCPLRGAAPLRSSTSSGSPSPSREAIALISPNPPMTARVVLGLCLRLWWHTARARLPRSGDKKSQSRFSLSGQRSPSEVVREWQQTQGLGFLGFRVQGLGFRV